MSTERLSTVLAEQDVDTVDEDLSRRQLDVLTATTTDFARAGVAHLLIGGWAIDFHPDRGSRNHSDVDFALWVTDRGLAARVRTRRGVRLDHSLSNEGVELFVEPVVCRWEREPRQPPRPNDLADIEALRAIA